MQVFEQFAKCFPRQSVSLGGFEIPPRTRDGMERFLRSVTSGGYGGLASYRPRERPSRTMTAEALTCRFFLDLADSEAAVAALRAAEKDV